MNLEDVNSFLFTHHSNMEPMVFCVPNKAIRNSLKQHVNVNEGVARGVTVHLCMYVYLYAMYIATLLRP